MKAMLIAFVAAGLIAVVAYYGLGYAGFGADERSVSASVRLD